jgi:hypothetical protein
VASIWLAALFCIALGCSSASKQHDALALAKRYAQHAGYRIEDYEAEVGKTEHGEVGVFFVSKERGLGNHFMVLVCCTNAVCRLVEGR